MSDTLGSYALGEALAESEGYVWRAASRSGEEEPGTRLVAKLARTEEAGRALSYEARRAVWLSERASIVPRPVDWVAGQHGALVSLRVEGDSLQPPLDLDTALALAGGLVELQEALFDLDLTLAVTLDDLLVGPGGVWLTGLHRLEHRWGVDPIEETQRWGQLVGAALGAPQVEGELDLEGIGGRVPPTFLSAVRAALEGRDTPSDLWGDLHTPDDELALPAAQRARRAAAFGLLDCLRGPHGVLYLACWEEGQRWLAIDPRLDAVVRLSGARDALSESRPQPVVLAPAPLPPLPFPEPPPRLQLRRRPEGTQLHLHDLAPHTDAVLLIRRRGGGSLLVPEDGEQLAALEPDDFEEPFLDVDAVVGDRFAAFPLFDGLLSPPARARL